ncbi:hypothetical protein FQN57_006325 [Myotisia sp. PD_48]|nr:hypothetical protein FQN57_006325 [Myotisia sp. PD_48]
MSSGPLEEAGLTTIIDSGRSGPPDLRILHYNDVYHVESSSAEPCGGVARFQSLINHYRSDPRFNGQSSLLTFFSGDAFNPSLESAVTKGQHMVPFLNKIGTDVACVGNHDLDFGIAQFRHLRSQCKFPWLLANVLDPALGENVPLANCLKTYMFESSNGIKIGVIGLGEREWLSTINSLPPNLIYKSASETAKELIPGLREQGAEIIVAVTHQREPNDNKLAEKVPPGMIDIILGGHDHFYGHSFINSTHVLRSGCDFKQLSYIEAWRKENGGWDFSITRRDILRALPKDPAAVDLVKKLTSSMQTKLQKPIGYTATPLDGRFSTVRSQESNLGNFVCDLMRFYYDTDCALMAAGTMRGDQIYPPGILRVKDILHCFPFEDPVVVVGIAGKALRNALENGVSLVPAMEGRFPQVSNISFEYDPSRAGGDRIVWAKVGGQDIEDDKLYSVATRGYMARGKDGYTSLLVKSEGGEAEEIISEEDGLLISTMLRQYFLSLKVLGKWQRLSRSFNTHWTAVHKKLTYDQWRQQAPTGEPSALPKPSSSDFRYVSQKSLKSINVAEKPSLFSMAKQATAVPALRDDSETPLDTDSDSDSEILTRPRNYVTSRASSPDDADRREFIARRVLRKWRRKIGVDTNRVKTVDQVGMDNLPPWTRVIGPVVEGRIVRAD